MSTARALITGASSGIGAEFARQLAAEGRNLILVARRADALQVLAEALETDFAVQVDTVSLDLSADDAVESLFKTVQDRGLTVDYLINNAGSSGPDLLRDRDWQEQQRYIELMMTSVAGMCHFFVPEMRERGFGRVINVASVAGLVTVAGDHSYGPTKAYLVALSKGLAATLRGENVNILALCPGFTHTDFHNSESLAKMKRATPAFIWYDADVVVREALAAVDKGKQVWVSGRLYRLLVPILRTRLSRFVAGRLGVKRNY